MNIKTTSEILSEQLTEKINYEWEIVQQCVDKKFIRGIYTSLERLLKLYKQRDIKF